MPGISAKLSPIIPRDQPYPPDARDAARAVRNLRLNGGEEIARGFDNITASLNAIHAAARQSPPEINSLVVTDGVTGRVIAALGQYEVDGIVTSGGYFSELYAGDPYGNSDPAFAILSVTPDGKVQVGQNGWIDVLDPYGADAAWIGTQFDIFSVTGAVDNGSGLIRLTVTGHTLLTGDSGIHVLDVGGVPNATGIFTVTKIDANHIDLQNSVFVGTYTSGGTVDRLLHVTGAANNGAGKIRLTVTAHAYESGDRANIASVGGVPNATGQWTVTVFDANHFDLDDSTFAGAYTSGGTSLRYFAGGLFQTIAIGPSFVDYRLRAFADGTLRIRNAEFILTSANGSIVFDPTGPDINIYDNLGNLIVQIGQISGGIGMVVDSGGTTTTIRIGIGIEDIPGNVANLGATGVTFDAASGSLLRLLGDADSAGAQIEAEDTSGITRFKYGAELGFIIYDPTGISQMVFIDPTTSDITTLSNMSIGGTINSDGGYLVGSVPGTSFSGNIGTSLSVSVVGNGVIGTPGVGQANTVVVTGVTLNVTAFQWQDGILI